MMMQNRRKVALLISYHGGERTALSSKDAVMLYEDLTCVGCIGASDIQFLARRGTPYSESVPTAQNIERAFRTLGSHGHYGNECIVLLDGRFDVYSMELPDQPMDLDLLSALIEALGCSSVQVFIHGPGSDLASERLQAPGRVLVYSSRLDRGEKLEDPFMISRVFQGDEVMLTKVQNERSRLNVLGYELNWTRC